MIHRGEWVGFPGRGLGYAIVDFDRAWPAALAALEAFGEVCERGSALHLPGCIHARREIPTDDRAVPTRLRCVRRLH